ncbi:MAG: CRP-like cAMP-binding protein [Arenicella sp.]|jgi:CRP-like cAMP-binding protein
MAKLNMTDLEKQKVLSIVSNQGWFADLNDEEISRLVELSHLTDYAINDVVYTTGDRQENLYCIIEGLVKVSIIGDQGDNFPLTMWEAGNWFGEGALHENSVMPLEASAVAKTTALAIPITAIDSALDHGAVFYKNVLRDIIGRSQQLYHLVELLLFKTLQARVAARILHLIDLIGEPTAEGIKLPFDFSQSDIAHMSGGSRQRVNKIFRSWSSNGIVTKQDGWYVVHNVDALRAELKHREAS